MFVLDASDTNFLADSHSPLNHFFSTFLVYLLSFPSVL